MNLRLRRAATPGQVVSIRDLTPKGAQDVLRPEFYAAALIAREFQLIADEAARRASIDARLSDLERRRGLRR